MAASGLTVPLLMAADAHPHADPQVDPPDTVGQILSAVCAVHCVTTPFIVTLAPAAASVLGGAHPVLLVLVIGVALWSFVPGYRCHHSKRVAGLAVSGVTLLGLAAFAFPDSFALETGVSLVGATVMMLAHWLNRKLLREAHSHAHSHAHDDAHAH
jgi:cytochrome bd-type quinol oxidase subunit 2